MKPEDATEQAYKNGYEQGYDDGYDDGYKLGKMDAVKHGRWIEDQVEGFSPFGNDTFLLDVLQCSVCGEYFDVSDARNYCPNCGAKMDGDGQ